MRVLLDTNVLIAAVITQGVCAELLEHCIRRHQLVTSEFILNEFCQHLVRKFAFSGEEVAEAVALLRSRMEVVAPSAPEDPVCRDRDDDVVLATALAGNASCLVTGDKDLLVIKKLGTVDIVSPAEFSAYEAGK
jgi:putative PIN family toxin of toxin-antitoxin system